MLTEGRVHVGLKSHAPCHSTTIESAPKATEQAETRTDRHGKWDMEYGPLSGIQRHEYSNNAITDPDAYPGLPP